MKAIYFKSPGAIENISFGDVDTPKKPLDDCELRLQFLAGSLNHLDLWVLKGLPHLPYESLNIAGADLCARVVESRSGKFKEGDLVLVYPAATSQPTKLPENLSPDFRIRGESMPGVFCEYLHVHERYVFHAPKVWSVEEAAAFPLVYLTAWQMLSEKAGLSKESVKSPVLVHAAGSGVSQALLEMLIALGVPQIAVTSRSEEKLRPWKERGLETFVWSDNLYKELKAFCGSQRFSIIFDHVGKSSFEMNIKLLANAGRLVSCGATSGFEVQLDLRQLFFRQLQLLGSTMGSLRHFKEVLDFVQLHQIKPHVSRVFDWKQPLPAYLEMDRGAQNGKIVLRAMN